MYFHIDPQFRHKQTEPRYFVRPLHETDTRFADGYRYQIQFLNECEQGEAIVEFRADEDDFAAFPLPIPAGVVNAVRTGIADYVDADGGRRLPGFLGGGKIDGSKG